MLAQQAAEDQEVPPTDTIIVVESQIQGASVTETLPVTVLGATEIDTIGAGNTLVFLNGRRLVDHSGTQTNEQTVPEVTVNSNQIPVMGIQRLEIGSAIYELMRLQVLLMPF